MNGDDAEIADYLCSLLEHGENCASENCPLCLTLHGVFELVRKQMFTSPLYPERTLAATAARSD